MDDQDQTLEGYIGICWGDEGKGKLIDEKAAALKERNDGKKVIVVRFNGGPNAGHTTYVLMPDGSLKRFVTHASSSGLSCNVDVGIGPHVALDPVGFTNELNEAVNLFNYDGRIMISERCGVLFDYHKRLDGWREDTSSRKIGTTRSGMGPFYEDNARRNTRITFAEYISDNFHDRLRQVLGLKKVELTAAGILVEGHIDEYVDKIIAEHDPIRKSLAQFSERLEYRMQDYLKGWHHILLEGANGTNLDVDMGTIPDVSSSHITIGNAFSGLGLPRKLFKVYGVEKVYPTRVGGGLMPTLAEDEFGKQTVLNGGETGATTGRTRRVGYPDWVSTKRAVMLNELDGIFLTRADVVQDRDLKVCIAYEHNWKITEEMPLDVTSSPP